MAMIEHTEVVRVESADGTPIAHRRGGAGPPLVLVHGTSADRGRWAPVLPALEARFSVCAVDRRGRGDSGDGPAYALEREVEDIAAIVDSFAEPVHLLGHSYGAMVSLEAARLTGNLRSLVLYEGGAKRPGTQFFSPERIRGMQALVEEGRREEVVLALMGEVVTPQELELLRALPAWDRRIAAAHTIPRELAAFEEYAFDPRPFAAVRVPVLLLLGGKSPAAERAAAEEIAAALPDARIVVMPGQGHAAMDTGTELFVGEVSRFLLAH